MSDPSKDELLPDGVPSFDDSAYDDLRGLLADARASDPMPRDVADRIDDVIAGLSAERAGKVTPTRRSRTGQRLLVAAAAVVVLGAGGVGLSQVLGDNLSGNDDLATADKAASADGGSVAPESATAGRDNTPGTGSGANMDRASAAGLPRLKASDFSTEPTLMLKGDRVSVLKRLSSSYEVAEGTTDSRGDFTPLAPLPSAVDRDGDLVSQSRPIRTCALPDVLDSRLYAIYLDGKRATLVVHPVADGKRLVQAWSCDAKTILASTTIPR